MFPRWPSLLPLRSRHSPIASVATIYAMLGRVIPSRGPNDYGVLATVGTDADGPTPAAAPATGAQACARYVVLRGFDPRQHQLWINTNRRSSKVADLQRVDRAEVCLWLGRPKIQLRLLAQWQILDHAAARQSAARQAFYQIAWDQQPAYARMLYGRMGSGKGGSGVDDKPTEKGQGKRGRGIPEDFCVLVGTLRQIDALRLTIPRHEEFRYVRHEDQWELV